MTWTLGKAEKKDADRINELFIEMLQTIYNTDKVDGYAQGDLDRFFDGRDEWVSVAIADGQIIAFVSDKEISKPGYRNKIDSGCRSICKRNQYFRYSFPCGKIKCGSVQTL